MLNIFTPTELQTLHNTNFFAVKASATKKIEHLLADVRDAIKSEIENRNIIFPARVDSINGKIFRGENYLGLPYLVLDYPKHFSKESVFAFRTMFWWGNFFSCTLHLQGKALEEWRENLAPAFPMSAKCAMAQGAKGRSLKVQPSPLWGERERGLFICINNSPWQYHYKKDNYLPVNKLTEQEFKNLLLKKEFVKFSTHIPIKDYKKLVGFAKESFLYFYPER